MVCSFQIENKPLIENLLDVARIELHNDIFNENDFILYLIGLIIGPAFFSAAIYFSISRVISVFGTAISWFQPRKVTLCFISCDITSLVLQAIGGGIAASADSHSSTWTGIDIMIVGLSTQVLSTTAFCLVCLQLMWSAWRRPQDIREDTFAFRTSLPFRLLLWGMH